MKLYCAGPLSNVAPDFNLRLYTKADPTPAVPPEGAGDDWTAPEEEEGAFVLRSITKKLMVISLDLPDDVAAGTD